MHKFVTETMVPHLIVIEGHLENNGGIFVGKQVKLSVN